MTDVAFLAEQINFLHSEYETHQREAVTDAIAAGEALIEAKQHVGHGNWIDWVNTRLGFTERTARRYMQIARNRSRVSDMNNIREALGELAEPADDPKPEPPVTHQSYQVRLLERGEYGERHGSLEADNSPVEIHDLPAPMDETDEARHALIKRTHSKVCKPGCTAGQDPGKHSAPAADASRCIPNRSRRTPTDGRCNSRLRTEPTWPRPDYSDGSRVAARETVGCRGRPIRTSEREIDDDHPSRLCARKWASGKRASGGARCGLRFAGMARSVRLSIRVEPEIAAAVTEARGPFGSINAYVRQAILEKLERDVRRPVPRDALAPRRRVDGRGGLR